MLTAMVPLAAILFYNLYSLRDSKEREVHAEAFRIGQQAALEMQRIIGGVQDTLVAVSSAQVVQGFDAQLCNEYMAMIKKKLPQFSGISVVDTTGVIRCLQNPKGLGVSLADKDYIRQTLTKAEISVGLFTKGRVSKELVLPISVPIQDATGKVNGAVAGSLSLDWLQKRLYERNFAKNSAFTVADREGTILARYPDPEKFVGTRIPENAQKLVQAMEPGTTEMTSQDGTRRIIAYFPPSYSQSGLYVGIGLATDNEYAAIRRAIIFGITVTVVAIAIASLLAWLTAKFYIRRPVARLVKTVEAWRGNDETARSGLQDKGSEFGILSSAIDAYMDELVASRVQRQKDEQQRELLVGELDHRVKNLLSTVQAVARQSFKSANLDPSVLMIFNARLAAMGEAHAVIMKDQWQTANLAEVVRASIQPFDSPTSSPFRVSGPDAVMQSKAALAIGMALHELCTNAAKYGALSTDAGIVRIDWSIEQGADANSLVLRWAEIDGPAVKPPERSGFGSLMIERMLGSQIGGEVVTDYASTGLVCTITMPLSNVGDAA
jgi:two-component sensor histidine kinase